MIDSDDEFEEAQEYDPTHIKLLDYLKRIIVKPLCSNNQPSTYIQKASLDTIIKLADIPWLETCKYISIQRKEALQLPPCGSTTHLIMDTVTKAKVLNLKTKSPKYSNKNELVRLKDSNGIMHFVQKKIAIDLMGKKSLSLIMIINGRSCNFSGELFTPESMKLKFKDPDFLWIETEDISNDIVYVRLNDFKRLRKTINKPYMKIRDNEGVIRTIKTNFFSGWSIVPNTIRQEIKLKKNCENEAEWGVQNDDEKMFLINEDVDNNDALKYQEEIIPERPPSKLKEEDFISLPYLQGQLISILKKKYDFYLNTFLITGELPTEENIVTSIEYNYLSISPLKLILINLRNYYVSELLPKQERIMCTGVTSKSQSDDDINFKFVKVPKIVSNHSSWNDITCYYAKYTSLSFILNNEDELMNNNHLTDHENNFHDFNAKEYLRYSYLNRSEICESNTESTRGSLENNEFEIKWNNYKGCFQSTFGPFIQVRDIQGNYHLLNIIDLKFNKSLYTDIDNKQFTVSSSICDLIKYMIKNELEHIYHFYNSSGKSVFIRKPFLMNTIRNFLHCNQPNTEQEFIDIDCICQAIPYKELKKTLQLTRLYECLIQDEDINGNISVCYLNNSQEGHSELVIPKRVISSMFKKLKNNSCLPHSEIIELNDKNIMAINPFKIRPYTKSTTNSLIKPYIPLDGHITSFFSITNTLKKTRELISKKTIEGIIERNELNSSNYNKEELRLTLSPANQYNEYYSIKDMASNDCYIKRTYFDDSISKLMNNETIPEEISVFDINHSIKVIPIKCILSTSFIPKPSPYIKYNILDDCSRSLTNRTSITDSNNINDLFDIVQIKDLNKDQCVVSKAFLRKVLLNTPKEDTINIVDWNKNQKVISPKQLFATQQIKTVNQIEKTTIPSSIIYIKVLGNDNKHHLIKETLLSKAIKLIKDDEHLCNLAISDSDYNNVIFRREALQNINNTSRQWIKVTDIKENYVYVYKSIISNITSSTCYKDDTVEIYDYNCTAIKISQNQVLRYLNDISGSNNIINSYQVIIY